MKCEVCEKHKENIREYFKLYRQRPYVKEKTKKYFKEYMLDLMLNRGSMKSMYKN